MVRFALAMAFLLGGCASAEPAADEFVVPSLHPLELPQIERLTISENGIGSPSDDNAPRGCSGFMLDEAQARQFLGEAAGVDRRDYMHMLDWSPCHARGRIELADGRSGVWTIRQFQTGSILFDGGDEVFLYCPACTWEPFAW